MFIFGTRPEAIKMAPIILEAQKVYTSQNVKIVLTGQHMEMVSTIMSFFNLNADYNLELMKNSQTLSDISIGGLKNLIPIIEKEKPDLVLVQGDTTTAFIGALAAFYLKISVAHIEAGLRSGDKYSPFPEEVNRKMISNIAEFHFAPTIRTKQNLHNESIVNNVFEVGNSVIDSLKLVNKIVQKDIKYSDFFSFINPAKKIILVTAHRRENLGQPLLNICNALIKIVNEFEDIEIVFPVHPNPKVKNVVKSFLGSNHKIHLIEPLDYPYLVWLINRSYLILSDSGGIQEEAPSLGKPVLVLRELTERTEGIDAGTAKLVGTNERDIYQSVSELLNNTELYKKMSIATNPYGNGTTSSQILEILKIKYKP